MSRYGIEVVEVKEAPEITDDDVISQSEAAALLGVSAPSVVQAINRGKYTVVWDLEKDGGMRSARLLLRSEVEAAAAGHSLSRAPRRQAPVISP
jgi:predicted transcriptional regulator